METDTIHTEFNQTGEAPAARPLIQLRSVVKAYPTAEEDFYALRGITVDVYPNEFLGIIGKSGAGKSTLLNMITGIDHITSGEVLVNNNGLSLSP